MLHLVYWSRMHRDSVGYWITARKRETGVDKNPLIFVFPRSSSKCLRIRITTANENICWKMNYMYMLSRIKLVSDSDWSPAISQEVYIMVTSVYEEETVRGHWLMHVITGDLDDDSPTWDLQQNSLPVPKLTVKSCYICTVIASGI